MDTSESILDSHSLYIQQVTIQLQLLVCCLEARVGFSFGKTVLTNSVANKFTD